MTVTADANLTPEESAYQHLSSFRMGEKITVSGIESDDQPATITMPLRENGYFLENAFLVANVGPRGTSTAIPVSVLVSGSVRLAHESEIAVPF